jgi:MFS family permease
LWSIVLPAIVQAADWKAGWLGLGFFCLGVAALNYILVRNPAKENHAGGHSPNPMPSLKETYKALLKERVFWIIGLGYCFIGINVIIPFGFLPVFAREVLGLPYAQTTRFVAVIALAGVAGQLTLGPLSDTVGRIRVMMTCGVIMGTACLGMALSIRPWMLYGCAVWFGLGYGAVWPAYGAAASDFFAKEHTGGIVGLWTCLLGAGSVVSPVICGWSIDLTGSYFWAFVLGLLSGVLSAVVLLGAGKYGMKK